MKLLVLVSLLSMLAACAAYDPPHQFNDIWHAEDHYPEKWRQRRK